MTPTTKTPRERLLAIRDTLRERYDAGTWNIAGLINAACDQMTRLAEHLPSDAPPLPDTSALGRVNAWEIAGQVASRLGYTVAELQAPMRTQNVTHARHIAMYAMHKRTTMTLQEIGDFFGRDHSTVLHALNKIEAWERSDSHGVRAVLAEIGVGA